MFKLFILMFTLSFASQAYAANLSADDFLPPVQATSSAEKKAATAVQDPKAVKQEPGIDAKPAIRAASAQDAVNTAIKSIPEGGGCLQIKFPSGFGWVATGIGVYSVMPNPQATLTAQRLAYQKAYLNAKKFLAESLYGLTTAAKNTLASEMELIITGQDNAANTKEQTAESIQERINGLIRGYVLYSIDDNQNKTQGTVTVTIVTTPKTMGKIARVNNNAITADSIRDGLNYVLSEIANGLMPPVGGKVISIPKTGELAFVGFGSAIVQTNSNEAVAAKMRLNSQKIAQMRARSALCGIILGDSITATSSLDSTTKELSTQFEKINKDDPLQKYNSKKEEGVVKKLEAQRMDFVNNEKFTEQITSFKSGVLPAGIVLKTTFNDDKTMAQSVAIYIPTITAEADKARQDIQNAHIVKQQSNQKIDSKTTNEGTMPKKGASGQVMKNEDL